MSDQFTYLGETPEDFGLRFVGYADTGRGYFTDTTENTGFYCDTHASETCFGVVYQLPARKGFARYVAGYDFTDRDGGLVLNLNEIFEADCRNGSHWDDSQSNDAARDAALMANEHARVAAEHAREYDSAWQAGSSFAHLGQEVAELKSELREILGELKSYRRNPILPSYVPSICKALRAQVSKMLDDIKTKREKRNELQAGDNDSFYFYPSPEMIAAFNEGAEI